MLDSAPCGKSSLPIVELKTIRYRHTCFGTMSCWSQIKWDILIYLLYVNVQDLSHYNSHTTWRLLSIWHTVVILILEHLTLPYQDHFKTKVSKCTGAFSRIWPYDLVSEPMWPSFEHDFYSVEANILNQFYEEHVETIIYSSCFLSFNLVTYFWHHITQFGTWPTVSDIITAQGPQVFHNYLANLWLNMYPPILRIHLKIDQQRTYLLILMWCFCVFYSEFLYKAYVAGTHLYKAYVAGTHLNCINKLMQFKWVPTTYAFIKK